MRNVVLGVRVLALAAVVYFVVTLVTGGVTEVGVAALVGAVGLVVVVGIVDLVVRRRSGAG